MPAWSHGPMTPALALLLSLLLPQTVPGAAMAQTAAPEVDGTGASFSMPVPDAARGRRVFVNKGCVICHAVNGIGGRVGPALDASEPAGVFDPLDFAARMWRGAPAMTALQDREFGYVIDLSGPEIADLAAFAESHLEQSRFTEEEIPEMIRDWMFDAPIEEEKTDAQ